MEKQSTSKFLRSVIAVVALFMLVVSGLFLASCKEEECSHPTTNDFGACTECNVIVDWTKYEAKLDGIITPNFDDLTASLNDLKSNVSDVASDVDSVITKIGDIDLGADITTIVDTVNNIRDEIVALLGAEEVTDKATPATITGIAKALDDLQASVKKVQEDITGVEKVCKDHDFDTETLIEIIPASCTENGLGYYRCKNCNAVISQPIEAKGHTEVVTETPVKAGDCTSQITVTTTCSVCGETLKTETKDGYADHEWVIDAESSTATCTEAGEVTYTCAHEGCTVTKTETAEALGHSADEGTVTTQPTCTTEGVKTFTCTSCGEVVRTEAVEKIPHTYPVEDRVWKYTGDIVFNFEINNTTVDKITQTQYDVCSVCGHEEVVMKEDGVTPVTRDTYHSLYIADATFADGNGDVRAKADLTAEDLTKYGLNEGGINADKFVNDYVNVSCAETAQLLYLCNDTDCPVKDEHYITVDLPALEHVWVADTTKTDVPATCTSTGIHYEVCSACGTTDEEPTDKLDHTYDDAVVVDPSCGVEGTKTYTCNVCGEVVVEKIPALEHNYVPGEPTVVYVDNATHEVTTVYTCSNCQDSYEDVNYVAHGALVFESEEEAEAANKYGFNIYQADDGKFYFTNASCDDPGVRIYLCECGYWYEDTNFATKYVPQLRHVYDEDNAVYTEGSCVIAGKVQYYCERCGMLITETVDPADGHQWTVVSAVEETCTTNGNIAYAYCSVCGAVVEITNGETPDAMSTDYVDGLNYLTDKDAVEAWANIPATGHTFNEQTYILIAQVDDSCTAPAWKVYVCTVCGVVEGGEGAPDTYKIVKDDAAFEGAEPATVTVGEAGDEFINFLVGKLNELGTDLNITAEMLKSGKLEGFNIKGIEYVAETGHTLTDKTSSVTDGTWGYSENATIDCKVDTNLDSYADALAFAKFVNPELDEAAFKVAFDAIFGTNDGTRDAYEIKTDGTKPALAGVCKDCGMPIAITDHNEEYYMFKITNGKDGAAYDYSEPIDVDNAYVHTDTYLVKDAEGNTAYKTQAEIETSEGAWTKVVFTYEEVVGMKYTNPNGSVNCYFEGFCANGCGIDMGHKAQHTFPVPQQYDKYHNCMHGDICVWCSKVLALSDEHNMQDLEEIAASDITEYAEAAKALYAAAEAAPEEYPWVGKDTENATCLQDAYDYTITVCVSCLLEWNKQGPNNFEGWSEVTLENPDGNYTSKVDPTKGEHNYVVQSVGDKEDLNCLVGYAEWYQCSVCGDKLTYEERYDEDAPEYIKNLKDLHENDYIDDENYHEAKPHTVAPVFNYFENSNYKPATDTTSAYMNFICVDCGEPLQGYYDNGVAEDGKIRYTMASDEDIAKYLADSDKVANWGNIQVVRPEDKAAVTTVEFAAGATDDDKVAAVAKAIADAEKEKATSVYLTIPGDFTIGASDTTTFTEGEATVWQAYGITFSADSSVKKIVFDLGDNKLTFAGTKVDEKTEAKVGATYKITGEGSVIFSNGTIEFTAFTAAQNPTFGFNANTTELVFDHITATVKGSAAFAGFGSTGEEAFGTMTIKNSKITTEGYYVVSTNASKSASSKVEINIIDSTLTSVQPDNDSVGIMFNVPGELNVSGSFVTADSQGMIIRGGDIKATIKDTEVTITGDCSEANVEGYDKYESDNWASGNGVPMGAFVIGDRSTSYEVGLATVVLEEVTIKAPEDVNKVYVYAQEGDTTVDLTITNADAAAPTLEAADIVNGSNANNAEVYKLTIDGAQVVPAPVVDEGNTEAQG